MIEIVILFVGSGASLTMSTLAIMYARQMEKSLRRTQAALRSIEQSRNWKADA